MNWRGIWHLGTCYLRRNRIKTLLLTSAFTLVWFLPAIVSLVVSSAETQLRARSASTPLVIGRSGSPLELAFNALYFTKRDLPSFPINEIEELREGVTSIPLYCRFHSRETPIVGTSLDYFKFRKLAFEEGRPFVRLGECVIGEKVAARFGLSVGDSVISSPGSILDMAGVYPLKMNICGVLKSSGSPDDASIFVDVKTAWIIEGLGHGHEEATTIDETGRLPGKGEDQNGEIKLNASVIHYNEITPDNVAGFHFHGDPGDFPITAAIAIPGSMKTQAFLKDDFQLRDDMQIITPSGVMKELFDTVFQIQAVVTGILILIGLATVTIGFLVFGLSNRLRRREFESLHNMGARPWFLRSLIAFEAGFVFVSSVMVAWLIWLISSAIVPDLIKRFLY